VVAEQKGSVQRELIRGWTGDLRVDTFLKTDLFEEANGGDQLLFDLFPAPVRAVGMDVAQPTVSAAARRCWNASAVFLASDIRHLAVRSESVDLAISTSTLDHFDSAQDIRTALAEMARVVRPGGMLVVTLDNPHNPLYPLLRWASRLPGAPFALGRTMSREVLNRTLHELGLEVLKNEWLLHNPRIFSTLLFLGVRRLLGVHANRPIHGLLRLFAQLGHLPSRRFTACFVAACARKPF
jgi:SAM-dependent methyltransferase